MKKIININIIVLILFIVSGIVIANCLGQDANWDLAAYHYYSVYALFNNRIGFDVMPCGIQSYLNPLMDIPFYFMVKYLNDYPRLVAGIQSLYWSFSVFLTYLIAKNIYRPGCSERKFFIFFSVILGATGFVSIVEIGCTFNDLIITVFILGTLLIFSKYLFAENSKKRSVFIAFAGLILGMAAGLKPSAFLFFASVIISLICLFKTYKKPLQTILILILSTIAGYIITNGYWMYILYSDFQNPFFPYYNDIFQSPLAPLSNHMDIRHMPKSLAQWIFFPFYWGGYSFDNVTIEFAHIDYRYIVLYLTFFIIFAGNFAAAKIKQDFSYKLNILLNLDFVNFLILFLFFAYIIWIKTSATLRYILPLEFLCGIYISVLFIYIKILTNSSKITKICAITALCILLFTTRYAPTWMTRRPFDEKVMYVPDLNLPDNAIVCILGGYPSQVFIPFQNPKVKFVYIRGEINYPFVYNDNGEKIIKAIISDPSKRIYLLYALSPVAPLDWDVIKKYINPDDYECQTIYNSTFYVEKHKDYKLCSPKEKNK